MGTFGIASGVFLSLVLLSLLNQIDGQSSSKIGGCNIYQGNWVLDNSYPLYDATKCPFILKTFDCLRNGRPDKNYLKYRWQPQGCNLPRFDARQFLARFKGKSIMFIGDSLSLNQWQSLTCMIHSAVPEANFTLVRNNLLQSTVKFPAFDVTINLYRNAFLVDIVKEGNVRVLKLDSISSSSLWEKMDLLVFDTWHWWLHTGRKQPWDAIEYGGKTMKDMDRLAAYDKALNTWAKWVNTRLDTSKTKVFFQGVSPDHFKCETQTQPLKTQGGPRPEEVLLEKVISSISKPGVQLLNINGLSQLRADGHPSIYGLGGHRGLDCTHWCLPGVPDIWNQLLYASL